MVTVKRTWKYAPEKRQLYIRQDEEGLGNKHINLQTKLRLYEALILLNLLYGAEVWPLTSYRHIEQETGSGWEAFLVSPCGTKSQMKKYGKNRTNTSWEGDPKTNDAMAWSCHENGWSTHSEASAAWEVAGFRRPGKPRMNWRDVVKKDLQRMGLTWEEVEASAQERHSWHQRVALCVGDAGWIKV